MAYVPYAAGELPNLLDVTKRMDPDGSVAAIAELLTQTNEILLDIPMKEGNLPTGHRHTVRTGIPTPTWRKLNYGVRPTKSSTAQVDDTCGMLEDYGEVDVDLAGLNGNTAEFRMSEDRPHIEGMSNTMATTLFYGDTDVNPERFLGLAPRYNNLGTPSGKFPAQLQSAYLQHVISAGGSTASSQTSLWYIHWGENTVFGIYPKGSTGGLSARDLGEHTVYDNEGGRFQAYRTHYQWKNGLCVKDWRGIVRICNIELADMTDSTAQQNLWEAMIKARHTVPKGLGGRGMFYASKGICAMLDLAATNKANAAFGWTNVFGEDLVSFRGVPIRECNAILETEAVVTV